MGSGAPGKESEPRHLVCYPVMDVAADVQEAQVWPLMGPTAETSIEVIYFG